MVSEQLFSIVCTLKSPGKLLKSPMTKPHPKSIKSEFLGLRLRHRLVKLPWGCNGQPGWEPLPLSFPPTQEVLLHHLWYLVVLALQKRGNSMALWDRETFLCLFKHKMKCTVPKIAFISVTSYIAKLQGTCYVPNFHQ